MKAKKTKKREIDFSESPFGLTEESTPARSKKKKRKPTKEVVDKKSAPKTTAKKKKIKKHIYIPEPEPLDSYDYKPKRSKLRAPGKRLKKALEDVENVVEIPKEQLDVFMNTLTSSSTDMAKLFLEQIAPVLLSFEQAMQYSSIALKEGLSYPNTIQLDLEPMIEWGAKLAFLNEFLLRLPLKPYYRRKYMEMTMVMAVQAAFKQRPDGGSGFANLEGKVGMVTSMSGLKSKIGTPATKPVKRRSK